MSRGPAFSATRLTAGAALAGLCTLLAACNPPPRPPLISQAEINTVAADCGISAAAIVVKGDKVRFDPPRGMAQSSRACVLKELRERLPHTSIEYPDKIKGQTQREETKP